MFEDFALTMAPFKMLEEPTIKNKFNGKYSAEYIPVYRKWMIKTWKEFWRVWHKYDEGVK